MEKKIWTKPEVGAVVFPANAYCASCTSVTGEYTHAHDFSTFNNAYFLFAESTGNNTFDYDNTSFNSASNSYESKFSGLDPDEQAALYGQDAYFEHMVNYSSSTSDQIFRFPYRGGTQIFDGCDDPTISTPSEGVYSGWWYSNITETLVGRAQYWWDSVNKRIHALFASVSHS